MSCMVLRSRVKTHLPHNYTLLTLPRFICSSARLSDVFDIPTPTQLQAHTPSCSITRGPFRPELVTFATNQRSHVTRNKGQESDNDVLQVKGQVLLVGLLMGLGPRRSCSAPVYGSRLQPNAGGFAAKWLSGTLDVADGRCSNEVAPLADVVAFMYLPITCETVELSRDKVSPPQAYLRLKVRFLWRGQHVC